ncbi:MAG: prephenate dehydratase [Leptospiraceae bacterium]|nr:prephenate dehydratase [Leptospiraceae bacterium]MCP5510515.1 prephenate dehydratase [Leptospiraceae bacterium]
MRNEDLQDLRKKIDSLDKEIVDKIQERASYAIKIGETKRAKGEPIYRPDREKEVYEKIQKLSNGPLPANALRSIYREIMSASIAIEKGLHVAYLGPEGSFSHQAVRARFGTLVESIQFNSIPDVFKAVETDRCDYGVVPIENSSEGLVSSTMDMFLQSDLKIYSEIYIKISLCLLAYNPDQELSEIKKLYGIKIGNSQCKHWIATNLPNCEIIETSSTAKAALLVAEKKEGGAIASKIAGEIYGLNVVRENIEDLPNNSTRFLIIGKSQCQPTGRDKTSMVFTVSDSPGSLFNALKPFYERKINLSKIESRPTRRNPWQYNFFIDFLGHEKDPEIIEILDDLKKSATFLRILGSYPAADSN